MVACMILFCLWGCSRVLLRRRHLRAEELMMLDAENAAKTADATILVLGTHGQWEIESIDQPHPRLLGRQDELVSRVAAVAAGPIVVILNVGSPKELPWVGTVDAILLSHFGGE